MSSQLEFLSDPQSEHLNWVKLVSATHSTDEHRLAGLDLSPSRQPVPLLLQEQGHVGSHPPVPVDIIHSFIQLAEMLKVICKNTPLCHRLNPCVKLFQLCEYSRPAGLIASRAPVSALILFRLGCPVSLDQIILVGSCVIRHMSAPTPTLPHTIWNDSERFWPVGLGCVF